GDLAAVAATALGEIGDRRAVPALIAALGTRYRYPPSALRWRRAPAKAALALGRLGDTEAVAALIPLFFRPYHAETSVQALVLAGESAIPVLLEVLDLGIPRARYGALEALAQLKPERALPHLVRILEGCEPEGDGPPKPRNRPRLLVREGPP